MGVYINNGEFYQGSNSHISSDKFGSHVNSMHLMFFTGKVSSNCQKLTSYLVIQLFEMMFPALFHVVYSLEPDTYRYINRSFLVLCFFPLLHCQTSRELRKSLKQAEKGREVVTSTGGLG